jgi:divalent metal cation (Fe/Co/Zn/Cd) transporter
MCRRGAARRLGYSRSNDGRFVKKSGLRGDRRQSRHRNHQVLCGGFHRLLTLEIQFKPTITAEGVEGVVDRIEEKIRNRFPDIKHILIEAESITKHERDASAR